MQGVITPKAGNFTVTEFQRQRKINVIYTPCLLMISVTSRSTTLKHPNRCAPSWRIAAEMVQVCVDGFAADAGLDGTILVDAAVVADYACSIHRSSEPEPRSAV